MKTLRIVHGLLFAVIIFIKRATNPYYTQMILIKHFPYFQSFRRSISANRYIGRY
jgi:hypothetical protein